MEQQNQQQVNYHQSQDQQDFQYQQQQQALAQQELQEYQLNQRMQQQQNSYQEQDSYQQQQEKQYSQQNSQHQNQQEEEQYDEEQMQQYQQQQQEMMLQMQQQEQQQQLQQNQDSYVQNSQDQYKINSPDRSSKQVLQRVFDGQFSVNQTSPSPQRNINDRTADNLNQMAANLSKININESQQMYKMQEQQNQQKQQQNYEDIDVSNQSQQQQQSMNGSQQQIGEDDLLNNNGENQDQDQNLDNQRVDVKFFDQCYKQFLSKIAVDQGFVNATYEQKIAILIDYFSSQNLEFRLGALIFLFELIYNFRESLTDHAITLILSQIFSSIPFYYETKDYYNVYCALEIIGLIGPHNISYNNIKLLASILIDEAIPALQEKACLALINLDYPGFYALLDIANKDFNDVPNFILNQLAKTEEIQLSVIIPSLLNDINTGDSKKRVSSLAALNRMYSLIYKAGSLPVLIQLLQDGTLDRQLVVSTIRACGEIGEQTLLKIARQTPNSKIKLAISTVLSWRVKSNEKNQLKVDIIPYQVALHYNVNPGTMCIYEGDLTPLAFIDQDDQDQLQENDDLNESQQQQSQFKQNNSNRGKQNKQVDSIQVNSRDFMAALQRLLAVKFEKFQNNQDLVQSQHDINQLGLANQFTLAQLIDPSLNEDNNNEQNQDNDSEQNNSQLQNESQIQGNSNENKVQISENIIKGLCKLVKDDNIEVRRAAINSLGIIGYPETKLAIDQLYATLSDKESQIRAMGAWCFGRLGENLSLKIQKKLIQLLKDNYWKVRTAACVAIGAIGLPIADLAFEPLTKILKDNSINKLTVCETLVRLGIYGEQILIDILKQCPQSNFKLKSAIIQAFQLANVSRPTIDFIIEELFKNANDSMIQVRKSCLNTLEILRNRALDSNITYLKSKNILPLFYFFLQDQNADIREMAMYSIRSFGPQAELIFIEGLTKDKNPIIRAECAKGLSSMGVQNFRALLFGLRDIDENVRKITATCIRNYFEINEILEEYQSKESQVPALLVNIKDILSLPFMLHVKTREILEKICIFYGEDVSQLQQQAQKNFVDYNSYVNLNDFSSQKQQNENANSSRNKVQPNFTTSTNKNSRNVKINQQNKNNQFLNARDKQIQAQRQLPKQQYVQYEPKNSSFSQLNQFEDLKNFAMNNNYMSNNSQHENSQMSGRDQQIDLQPDVIPVQQQVM